MKRKLLNLKFNNLAILFILAGVLVIFRGLIFGEVLGTNDYGGNDLLLLHVPTLQHYAQALKEGVLLQWIPEIFCGFPVFAEGQNGFLYPVNILLYYIFDLFTALNIYHILHPFLMGIGSYYLIKRITANPYAALSGAIAASLCGSLLMGHTRHLGIYAIISLTPFMLLTIENFLQKQNLRYGLMSGTLFGILALIGHPQFAFISVFLVLMYFILRLVFFKSVYSSNNKRPKLKTIIQFLLITIIIAIIISLPQFLSTYELYKYTERAGEVSNSFRELGSLPYDGIITFIDPYYWGNAGDHTYEHGNIFYFWEWFHYVGLLTLLLSIIGAIFQWNRSGVVRSLVIIAIFSYMLALGGNFPLYKIFSIIPGVQNFRFPNRWLLGTELSFILLSGFGLLTVFKWANNLSGKDLSIVIGIIASLVIFIDIYLVVGKRFTTIEPEVYFHRSPTVDILYKDSSFYRVHSYYSHRILALAFEKSKGWENDQHTYRELMSAMPDNISAYHGINQSAANNLGLIPNYLAKLWGSSTVAGVIPSLIKTKGFVATPDFAYIRAMQLYGVKYIPTIIEIKGLPIISGSSFVKIHKVPEPMPRAWVVNKLLIGPTKHFYSFLNNGYYDFNSMAYFPYMNQSLPPNSASGKIEVVKNDHHSLIMNVETPGMAVVSDTWYPRWKAKVNGKPKRIFRINSSMRGVLIEEPNSILEMYYDYRITVILGIISYLLIFLSLILFYHSSIINLIKR